MIVNRKRPDVIIAGERAEILHPAAARPEKRATAARAARIADYLGMFINRQGRAMVVAGQRAKILYLAAARPEKCAAPIGVS